MTVHVDADGKCPEALHYPARGYFWLDGHVVRAAEDGKLKFNIESNVWLGGSTAGWLKKVTKRSFVKNETGARVNAARLEYTHET